MTSSSSLATGAAAARPMIVLTYSTAADAGARGYDDWLRAVDNPTFNRVPGVQRYVNWQVVERRGDLPVFSHLDLLHLDGPAAVEAVWFDATLDEFRQGWVARWGYGAARPAAVNRFGYLCERLAPATRERPWLMLRGGGGAAGPDDEAWVVRERLRKHWAVGAAPPGTPWREPADDRDLGFADFTLAYADGPAAFERWRGAMAGLLARRLAAPPGRDDRPSKQLGA